MDLVKGASPEQISGFLKDKFGEKRQIRSEAKLVKYPPKGEFYKVDVKTAKIDGNDVTYPVVLIADGTGKNAKIIGDISFTSIHRSIFAGKTQKVAKKNSKYEGKYMNATKFLHQFSENKSEAETIAHVLGKAYTAEDKKVVLAVVDYDKATDTVLSIVDNEADCKNYLVEKDVCFITLT